VGVYQARGERAPGEVHHLRAAVAHGLHLGLRAHQQHPPGFHGHRLGLGQGRVHGDDRPADEGEVGVLAHLGEGVAAFGHRAAQG